MGDSLMNGFGLNSEESFPSHLNRFLTSGTQQHAVKVVNVGYPGYNALDSVLQYYWFFSAYPTHLIVWELCQNDIEMFPTGREGDWTETLRQIWSSDETHHKYFTKAFDLLKNIAPCPVIVFYNGNPEHDLHRTASDAVRKFCQRYGFHYADVMDIIASIPETSRKVNKIDNHPSGQMNLILAKHISNYIKKNKVLIDSQTESQVHESQQSQEKTSQYRILSAIHQLVKSIPISLQSNEKDPEFFPTPFLPDPLLMTESLKPFPKKTECILKSWGNSLKQMEIPDFRLFHRIVFLQRDIQVLYDIALEDNYQKKEISKRPFPLKGYQQAENTDFLIQNLQNYEQDMVNVCKEQPYLLPVMLPYIQLIRAYLNALKKIILFPDSGLNPNLNHYASFLGKRLENLLQQMQIKRLIQTVNITKTTPGEDIRIEIISGCMQQKGDRASVRVLLEVFEPEIHIHSRWYYLPLNSDWHQTFRYPLFPVANLLIHIYPTKYRDCLKEIRLSIGDQQLSVWQAHEHHFNNDIRIKNLNCLIQQ